VHCHRDILRADDRDLSAVAAFQTVYGCPPTAHGQVTAPPLRSLDGSGSSQCIDAASEGSIRHVPQSTETNRITVGETVVCEEPGLWQRK